MFARVRYLLEEGFKVEGIFECIPCGAMVQYHVAGLSHQEWFITNEGELRRCRQLIGDPEGWSLETGWE